MPKPPQKPKRLGLPALLLAGSLVAVHSAQATGQRRISSGGMNGHPIQAPVSSNKIDFSMLRLPFIPLFGGEEEVPLVPEEAYVQPGTWEEAPPVPPSVKNADDLAHRVSTWSPPPQRLGPSPRVRTFSEQAYLPVYGPVAMRVRTQGQDFDRAQLIPLSAYEPKPEEEPEANPSAEPPEGSGQQLADGSSATGAPQGTQPSAQAGAQDGQPASQPDIVSQVVGPMPAGQTAPVILGRPLPGMQLGGDTRGDLIDPTVVLRYFDDNNDTRPRPRNSVDIPFILPNQPQQPLIIEGDATYQRSDNNR